VAQKVGEEGVEAALAAVTEDEARLASESADLLYHLLVLLQSRSVPLTAVLEELERRTR
jgi:phosphoribosyl-ATP pyrophosphohydrolase